MCRTNNHTSDLDYKQRDSPPKGIGEDKMRDGDKLVATIRGKDFESLVFVEYERDMIYWLDYTVARAN